MMWTIFMENRGPKRRTDAKAAIGTCRIPH
jgi:hypothetical protein